MNPKTSTVPAIDTELALRRCAGKSKILVRVLEVFQRDAVQTIHELAEHIAAGDCKKIAQVAHRLKGSAANIAAEPVRRLSQEIEQKGAAQDVAGADASMASLRTEMDRCLEFIPEVCRGMSGD